MPSGVYKRTEEHKKNISKAQKGCIVSEETKRKMSETQKRIGNKPLSWKGKHRSEKTKERMSIARKRYLANDGINPMGMKGKHHSEETKRKISKNSAKIWLGKHIPKKIKRKISEKQKGISRPQTTGEKHGNWKGGISSLTEKIRHSLRYKEWTRKVFQRDNYTCQKTKIKSKGNIVAHHIKGFAKIIEENNIKTLEQALSCQELWDINNGITLSKKAHKEFHKIYGFGDNNKEQLKEFLKS